MIPEPGELAQYLGHDQPSGLRQGTMVHVVRIEDDREWVVVTAEYRVMSGDLEPMI